MSIDSTPDPDLRNSIQEAAELAYGKIHNLLEDKNKQQFSDLAQNVRNKNDLGMIRQAQILKDEVYKNIFGHEVAIQNLVENRSSEIEQFAAVINPYISAQLKPYLKVLKENKGNNQHQKFWYTFYLKLAIEVANKEQNNFFK